MSDILSRRTSDVQRERSSGGSLRNLHTVGLHLSAGTNTLKSLVASNASKVKEINFRRGEGVSSGTGERQVLAVELQKMKSHIESLWDMAGALLDFREITTPTPVIVKMLQQRNFVREDRVNASQFLLEEIGSRRVTDGLILALIKRAERITQRMTKVTTDDSGEAFLKDEESQELEWIEEVITKFLSGGTSIGVRALGEGLDRMQDPTGWASETIEGKNIFEVVECMME